MRHRNGAEPVAANPNAITISVLCSGFSVTGLEPGNYDLVIDGLEGWREFKKWIDGRLLVGESLRIRRPDGTTSVLIQRGADADPS